MNVAQGHETVVNENLRADRRCHWENAPERQLSGHPVQSFIDLFEQVVPFEDLLGHGFGSKFFVLSLLKQFQDLRFFFPHEKRSDVKERGKSCQNNKAHAEVFENSFVNEEPVILFGQIGHGSVLCQVENFIVPCCSFEIGELQKAHWPLIVIDNEQLRKVNQLHGNDGFETDEFREEQTYQQAQHAQNDCCQKVFRDDVVLTLVIRVLQREI